MKTTRPRKVVPIVTRTAAELAHVLDLSRADAAELEVRRQITEKLIRASLSSGMTQVQIAKAAGMSRTRLTAILGRNTSGVSTDLLLRILWVLDYQVKISFRRSSNAA